MNTFIEFLNQRGDDFLRLAQPMLVQSSLLIAVLLLLDVALRRHARAVVRYALLLLVLVKLVLPPSLALPTGLGYWVTSRLPAPSSPDYTRAMIVQPTSVPSDLPALDSQLAGTAPRLTREAMFMLGSVAGSLGLVGFLLHRARFVRRNVNHAGAASPALQAALADCARQIGLRVKVRLKVCNYAMSPALCGLWRPVILLPQQLADKMSALQLRAVLLHELAHIKRGDGWVNYGQTLLQIVYWWHPLIWLANAHIRRVREQAVDEVVMVELGQEAETYPATLLAVARFCLYRPLVSLGFVGIMESKGALSERIRLLVSRPAPKSVRLRLGSSICILVLAALALPMASGQKPLSGVGVSATAQIVPSGGQSEGSVGEAKTAVTIETRFLAAPDMTSQALGLGDSAYLDRHGVSRWDLSADELKNFTQDLRQRNEFNLLSAQQITTLAGRQAVLQVVGEQKSPSVFAIGVTPFLKDELIQVHLQIHAGQLSDVPKQVEILRWLQNEAETMAKKVKEDERNVKKFREGSQIPAVQEHQIVLQGLLQARADLSQAQADAAAAQSHADEVKRDSDKGVTLAAITAVTGDPIVSELRDKLADLQRELEILLQRYKEKWPTVQQTRQRIASLNGRLEERAKAVAAGIERNLVLANETERILASQVAGREREHLEISQKLTEFAVLERRLQTSRALYENVLARMRETENVLARETEISLRSRPSLQNPGIGEAAFTDTHFFLNAEATLANRGGAVFHIPAEKSRDRQSYLVVVAVRLEDGDKLEKDNVRMIFVTADGKYTLNEEEKSLSEIEVVLSDAYRQHPRLVVNLRAHKDTPWSKVVGVVELCKKLGIPNVAMRTKSY